MRALRLSALATVLAFAAIAMPRRASAFCRTTTDRDFTPTAEAPCDTRGTPLVWPTSCTQIWVNDRPSAQFGVERLEAVVRDAFATWSSVTCPVDPVTCSGAEIGRPSLEVTVGGRTTCGAQYLAGRDNANVAVAYDRDWPHPDADTTLALTTVSYRTSTGEILDADLEINADPSRFRIATGDPRPDEYDLVSIVVHEAGHFLGLAHTQPSNADATMVATYEPGTTSMRDLAADDVCGICAAAPPDREVGCVPTDPGACGTRRDPGAETGIADATAVEDAVPSEPEPSVGAEPELAYVDERGRSCAISAVGAAASGIALVFLPLLPLLAAARRRRRRR
jgi:hypothetical protein